MIVLRVYRNSAYLIILAALLVYGNMLFEGAYGENERYPFVVYYGSEWDDRLLCFNTAILSPLFNEAYVRFLSAADVDTYGYISISTVGGWEPWVSKLPDELIVGWWGEWGESIVNVSHLLWMEIFMKGIDWIKNRGFRGVFIDNLDMAIDCYPQFLEDAIALIKMVRERYPDMKIIVNRGFEAVEEFGNYVDGVLFECFHTFYNFTSGRYEWFRGEDREYIEVISEKLMKESRERGFRVFALSYVNPEDYIEDYVKLVEEAEKFDFEIYISDVYLDMILDCYKQTIIPFTEFFLTLEVTDEGELRVETDEEIMNYYIEKLRELDLENVEVDTEDEDVIIRSEGEAEINISLRLSFSNHF